VQRFPRSLCLSSAAGFVQAAHQLTVLEKGPGGFSELGL
jgi:hypothetical protein